MQRPVRTWLWAVLALLLLRYVLLAAACAPYGDDWGYAAMGMRTEPLQRLVHEYRTWNGRWFSNALVLYGPLTLGIAKGLALYRMVPVMLLALTVAAGAWALAAVPGGPSRRIDRWALSAAFALVHLHTMPHLGEGLFWYTGAVTYQGAWALILLHVGAVLRMHPRKAPWPWAVAALTLACAEGSNEAAMVLLVAGHAAWAAADLWSGRRPSSARWALLVLAFACGLVTLLAPGNAVRSMHFPHRHDLLLTLGMGGAQALRFAAVWLADPVVLAALVLAGLKGRAGKMPPPRLAGRSGPWPWLALAAGAMAVGTMTPYWAMGMLAQYRTLNFVLGPFLLGCLGAAVSLGERMQGRVVPAFIGRSAFRAVVLGTGLAGLLVWGNDLRITQDLLSGEAWRFRRHTAVLHRTLAEEAGGGKAVAEAPVFSPPLRSLRIPEPTPDPEAYWNRTMARYFGDGDFRVQAAP